MYPNKESLQREEFCDILFELARSQEILQDAHYRSDIYRRLESLYDIPPSPDKPFRHFYTDIFSVLTQLHQDPSLGDMNILGQNLDVIRNGYKPQNRSADGTRTIDVSDAIKKLYDHVNLDIARISYSDAADRRISGGSMLEEVRSQIHSIHLEVQKAQKKLSEVESRLEDSQKEYITILGIFAAVVLAFTGGIAFSTSVLNNIAQSSIYRTIIVSLIIGTVLINILFVLFYYVNSLVNREKRLLPLIVSELFFIVLLVVTILAWAYGWVEKRNIRIDQTISYFETLQSEEER